MIGLFLSLKLIIRRLMLLRFSVSDISSVIYGCSDCEGEEVDVIELSHTWTLHRSNIPSGSGH